MDGVDRSCIHPGFDRVLSDKTVTLQFLYLDTRSAILRIYPDSNELRYHPPNA